jgi:GR25 family glycosyltransferase involved in LPS biosynthesis
MISFSKLGNYGRLGNQLFQYAFLRTQAERLEVKFYCPKWIGDEIFDLNDKHLRAEKPEGTSKTHNEPFAQDYDRRNLNIQDNTDILGYFESEKNFDKAKVKLWYSFKKEKVARITDKYKTVNFSDSVGIHLRFGDKLIDNRAYIPRVGYYMKALEKISNTINVLVFSDEIEIAKKYLDGIDLRFIFITDNEPWEDLYLMNQCRDFICSSSTLSWWGGWLNNNPDKKVIFPKEGLYRTGTVAHNKDFIPDEWIKIRALIPIIDNYLIIKFKKYNINSDRLVGKTGRLLDNKLPFVYRLLKPYFPNKHITQIIRRNNAFNPRNWTTYYINLEKRTDRRKEIELELEKQNIITERFPALSDNDYDKCPNLKLGQMKRSILSDRFLPVRNRTKGEWGCAFSHYSILKKHLQANSDNVLAIFEDDAHFCYDFNDRLEYLANNFDFEWDIFYFSSAIKLPYNKKTNLKHVWKVEDVIMCTHAMLINPKSIPKILALMEKYAPNVSAIDILYSYMTPHLNIYCFIPGMVSQDTHIPGDIDNRIRMTSSFVRKYGNHVFANKLSDYDYGQTKNIIAWKNYYLNVQAYSRLLAVLVNIIGSIGKRIKSTSPSLYNLLKPYFPNKT